MSDVTNLVLHIDTLDEDPAAKITVINQYLEHNEQRGLVSLDDPQLPRRWYGGTKFLEAELYVGSFNGMDIDDFIEHIRSIPWLGPCCVQAWIKTQHDHRFRTVLILEQGYE